MEAKELSRAIAEMLVANGQLEHQTMQEGHYDDLAYKGMLLHDTRKLWITLLDGDELWGELHADYAKDANIALTLKVEGWNLKLEEWAEVGKPNSWLATYYNNRRARGVGHWADTAAEAICRARLALDEYLKEKPNGTDYDWSANG